MPSRGPLPFAQAANQFLSDHRFDCVFSLERGIKSDIYRAGDGVHRAWLQHRSKGKPLQGWFRNQFNQKNHHTLDLERTTFHPQNTQHIIANSEMVLDDIHSYFDFPEERIHLIPNGVDYEKFSSGDRNAGRREMGWGPEDFVCLLVGAGTERKGHALARKAVARLGSKMRLAIIDSPPPCTLPDLYAAADLFFLPTLYDPFANVTLEAMAAGLPVITTEQNGAKMVIRSGENGFIIRHASAIDDATAYLIALCDSAVRQRIAAEGQQSAAKCDIQTHLNKTIDLIDQACSSN